MYLKVLGENCSCYHGGSGSWIPGEWREVQGILVPCENGLHLCREQDLLQWLGPCIWEAEYEGEVVVHTDKIVVRKARITKQLNWNRTTRYQFAADCAERVLHLYEEEYPEDDRSRKAIEAARSGDANATTYAAANAANAAVDAANAANAASAAAYAAYAANAAANAAAYATAYATANAAYAAVDAANAAYAAANAANAANAAANAANAANAAAYAAAYAANAAYAERKWQTQRLLDYLYNRVA